MLKLFLFLLRLLLRYLPKVVQISSLVHCILRCEILMFQNRPAHHTMVLTAYSTESFPFELPLKHPPLHRKTAMWTIFVKHDSVASVVDTIKLNPNLILVR